MFRLKSLDSQILWGGTLGAFLGEQDQQLVRFKYYQCRMYEYKIIAKLSPALVHHLAYHWSTTTTPTRFTCTYPVKLSYQVAMSTTQTNKNPEFSA